MDNRMREHSSAGGWEDRALDGTMGQHPRRNGAVERDGECDDRGVGRMANREWRDVLRLPHAEAP
ncbi:MAG: hypothetical protein WBE26_03090 [Phycisphaerae bacterium]